MKSIITKTISLISLTVSIAAMAGNAIDTVNIEAIKQTLTQAQIQHSLNQWRLEELTNLESRAQNMSDKVPLEARREMAKQQIEMEYKQATKALSL